MMSTTYPRVEEQLVLDGSLKYDLPISIFVIKLTTFKKYKEYWQKLNSYPNQNRMNYHQ